MVNEATTYVRLVPETCFKCGVVFGIASDFRNDRLNDHGDFCCPNGHWQHFTGKSEADRLRDELARATARMDQLKSSVDFERRNAEAARRKAARARGEVTKVRNRVAAGVCPCCNRYFENLHRHMTTKHPEQAKAK